MNDTWVKLYRKINMNAIMQDPHALQLFMWVLTNVDEHGRVDFGRYIVARELKINPNTLYSALKRCVSKYKIISISSTTEKTTISLLNWSKYQSKKEAVNTSDTNPSTTQHQPDITYTRIENKNKEINTREIGDFFQNPPDELINKFHEKFKATKPQVKEKSEDLYYWWRKLSEKKKKEYSDPEAILRNALKKDYGIRIVESHFKPLEVAPEISEEQRQRNIAHLAEMRQKMKGVPN